MAENPWGTTPTDLVAKLDHFNIRHPSDLPEDFEKLKALVGEADARALQRVFCSSPCC